MSSTPLATALPATSTPLLLSGQSEVPAIVDGPVHYAIWLKASSIPVSISITPDSTQAPIPDSRAEMSLEIGRLSSEVGQLSTKCEACEGLEKRLAEVEANKEASEAHCTIMRRAASDAMEQMEQQKRRSHRPVKTSARYVACPRNPEKERLFAANQQEKERLAQEAAKKVAQKVA